MNRKLLLFVLFLLILSTAFFILDFKKRPENIKKPAPSIQRAPKESVAKKVEKVKKSIFMPYWKIGDKLGLLSYSRVFYFGVAADEDGINKKEPGYQNLSKFLEASGDKEKYLTLRMIDSDLNFKVLENQDLQRKIIEETVELAKTNNFQGIVLDLELFSLFNEKIPAQINQFIAAFYKKTQENDLRLAVAIYGDAFYRKRPYDLNFISKNSDEIIVMAYDFHKSRGEPGPNFPLSGREVYGYDFTLMVRDFSRVVPVNKLSVAFGMFGYDWTVDQNKKPIKPATPLTLNQIKENFLTACKWKNCIVLKNKLAAETEVNYIDENSDPHIVWFEDEKSYEKKREYLKDHGIENVVFWAYGHF